MSIQPFFHFHPQVAIPDDVLLHFAKLEFNKVARGCNENLVAYFASFFYIPNHHSSYILIFSYIQSLISNA